MKKIFLLITILFVSVVSTACINNIAVQELNNKAKEYMANGETEKAICRLRSSIDLDDSIFETHYNLGIALIEDKEFKEAKDSLENAIKLKPDYADSYYSLAVAFENLADELINKNQKNTEESDDTIKTQESAQESELTETDKTEIVKLLNSAIENYNTYIVKKVEAEDEEKVAEQIDYLNNEISKYNTSRNTNLSEKSDAQGTN